MPQVHKNKPISILIIEDNVVIGENLRENIEQLGYHVAGVARNDEQAYSLYKQSDIDLIIADIFLKGCEASGIDIVNDCLKQKKVPIIYLTAFNKKKYKDLAKLTHPAAYLIKPASINQIDVSIDFAISSFCRHQSDEHISNTSQDLPLVSENEIYIKNGERYEKIIIQDIVYIQAERSYTHIHSLYKSIVVSTSMKNLIRQISRPFLIKTHRSYIINRKYIHSVNDYSIFLIHNNEVVEVPISNSHKTEVFAQITKLKY